MSNFSKDKLTGVFAELGRKLIQPDEELTHLINTEKHHNAWFTAENVSMAIHAISDMLNETNIEKWLSRYELDVQKRRIKTGLVLAGNIPLVGFHDVLCVLITGNFPMIKASTQDARLIKYVLKVLTDIEPAFKDQYSFVERLEGFDAVIATGSNNTSRYFDYYFGKVPHIIRKNRNSVAVLKGDETQEQLFNLGHDIFDYFGLGCRNVSKIFIPRGYQFDFLFQSIEPFHESIHHNKYNNNYGYNKSIYLVGNEPHLDNGFLLIKKDPSMSSPLAVLYFEYYDDINSVEKILQIQRNNIQCVVSTMPLNINNQIVNFGESQKPALWDYADNIDTMSFLLEVAAG